MKKLFSRLFAVLLAANLLFLSFPTSAFATSPPTTINTFSASRNLKPEEFEALRTGSYSAVKREGNWYYKFVKGSTTVYVKASAFTSSVGNDYSKMTNTLSKGVTRSDGVGNECNYIYKYRPTSTTSRVAAVVKSSGGYKPSSNYTNKSTTKTDYHVYLSSINVYTQRTGRTVILGCNKDNHVQFTYSSKVYQKSAAGYSSAGYVTPSTSAQYKQALTRNTSNSVNVTITPEFTVKVTQPGSNKVILSNFQYAGKGQAITTKSIDKYVNIGYTTAKTLAAAYSGKLSVKNLYDLYKQATNLVKPESSEYNCRKTTLLSKTSYKCLQATFDSPIKLKKSGDYFQTELNLSSTPSRSGTATKITVNFSI